MKRSLAGVTGAMLLALTMTPTAHAVDPSGDRTDHIDTIDSTRKADDLPGELAQKQRGLQRAAVDAVVTGKAAVTTNKKGKKVIKVGNGQYVSYDVDREEDIFTILAEFGDKTDDRTGGTPGPLHNQIPQPDRTQDNSTIWAPNFDRNYYMDVMFNGSESFRDFYLKQSNGRFMAKGDVSDWVKVPYNEARYGSNKIPTSAGASPFIADAATAWYDQQKAAGRTDAQIADYLKQFDKVDRYDYDGDGDFNEPDGYIDHFQAIHAGEGEEAGGGKEGEDAIWAHRSYAFGTLAGKAGPSFNKAGGAPIGSTGLWIGDYTTEPENGGLGVFTHEFGHDLGLPDLYDTAGGDNGTGFWSLMSSGSWLNNNYQDIGSSPGYMGPWEKLQLGWLDYTTVPYGKPATVKLGAAPLADRHRSQAALVQLPDKSRTTTLIDPHSGCWQWWSGAADKLNVNISRPLDLTGATSPSLSAWIAYDTEEDFDYAYVEVTADGGATWTQLGAYSGDSKGYVQKTYDLSAYAGKKISVRFRYTSDGGVHGQGMFVDDIAVTGAPAAFTDDVESGDNGWTAKGFKRVGSSVTEPVTHYYLAENRTYIGYDRNLWTGPYNFGWADTKPKWVERFPYQNGMLVWYVNNDYTDNNTKTHPGGGHVLPVDVHPEAITFPDGKNLANRRGAFDATFGLERTDEVTFHRNGAAVTLPSRPGVRTFDDRDPARYWSAGNPWNSTKVAGAGVQIQVRSTALYGERMDVRVGFDK